MDTEGSPCAQNEEGGVIDAYECHGYFVTYA